MFQNLFDLIHMGIYLELVCATRVCLEPKEEERGHLIL